MDSRLHNQMNELSLDEITLEEQLGLNKKGCSCNVVIKMHISGTKEIDELDKLRIIYLLGKHTSAPSLCDGPIVATVYRSYNSMCHIVDFAYSAEGSGVYQLDDATSDDKIAYEDHNEFEVNHKWNNILVSYSIKIKPSEFIGEIDYLTDNTLKDLKKAFKKGKKCKSTN